jgi:hypothetical protein
MEERWFYILSTNKTLAHTFFLATGSQAPEIKKLVKQNNAHRNTLEAATRPAFAVYHYNIIVPS